MMRFASIPAAALLALTIVPSSGAPPKAAIFDFQLIDTSIQGATRGVNANETKRIASISDQLRQLVAKSGKFEVVDVGPVKAAAEKENLATCNGCDATLAKKIGADLAIVGTVQKVSELILNVTLYVRDANSGKLVGAMSADMRGNTDESWSHTLSWLVRNRLLQPDFGQRP